MITMAANSVGMRTRRRPFAGSPCVVRHFGAPSNTRFSHDSPLGLRREVGVRVCTTREGECGVRTTAGEEWCGEDVGGHHQPRGQRISLLSPPLFRSGSWRSVGDQDYYALLCSEVVCSSHPSSRKPWAWAKRSSSLLIRSMSCCSSWDGGQRTTKLLRRRAMRKFFASGRLLQTSSSLLCKRQLAV